MSSAAFRALAREAAARYPARDRFARHFAYGKLTRDPVFEHLIVHGLVRDSAPLVDVGCGQGLVAALLEAACARHQRGEWPAAWPAPARPSSVRGFDLSARDVARARAASPDGEWIAADMRSAELPAAGTAMLLDVLHYIEPAAQEAVLERVARCLRPDGIAIIRVGDANETLRFRVTMAVDHLACALRGHRVRELHCRPVAAWIDALGRNALAASPVPMSEGTPFANVLLVARPA